jgi:hypothetical protein
VERRRLETTARRQGRLLGARQRHGACFPGGAWHGWLRERCKEIRKGDQKRSHRSPQEGDKAGRPARKKRMKGKNEREEREKCMKKKK